MTRRAAAADRGGRIKLAGYMIRAPMSLEKMIYGAANRHGDLPREAARLNIDAQEIPGAEWLERLCKHISDQREHLVRNVGWYSCVRSIRLM